MKEIYQFDSVKKGVIVCLKITVILGVFFSIVFQQTTLQGILLTFSITAMYSFGLGLGNGFLNKLLSSKWDWVTQTNQRVVAGIIGTIIYTIIIVLIIDYVQIVVLNGLDISLFFSERMNLDAFIQYCIVIGYCDVFTRQRFYD